MILTTTHISSKKCKNYIVSKLNRLKGLNEKCENILSQEQILSSKPHIFSKKSEIHVVSKPNGVNRLNKKCKNYIILKLILLLFKIKTRYFQSATRKLQFFNDYQMKT